jgi:hypothetical protein
MPGTRRAGTPGRPRHRPACHGVPRTEAARRAKRLPDVFGLAGRAGDKPGLFSGGQSQRVMIARVLMHDPVVLFLDEPSTGLDPAARLFAWDRIRELRDQGTTVLLTTHDMDEAEALADRVGITGHGHLLAPDSPQALVRSLPGGASLDITITGPAERAATLAAPPGAERAETADPLPTSPATGKPHEPMRYHVWLPLAVPGTAALVPGRHRLQTPYASEGLRAALDPRIPHLPGWACLFAPTGWSLLMPGTPPRPVVVAEEEPALYVCVWDHVARTLAWLDAVNGRGPHETAVRVMKIAEETGETVAAYIGMTEQNPRKGTTTATTDDLAGELCDVVLAALVALATITGSTPQAESRLNRHVAAPAVRLRALRAAT